MSEYFKKYLKNIKFEKNLRDLKKKLKDKKIIIYGTGLLFQYINENFDLSELNILGVSDIKFSVEQDGEKYLGYNVIPKSLIGEKLRGTRKMLYRRRYCRTNRSCDFVRYSVGEIGGRGIFFVRDFGGHQTRGGRRRLD